MAAHPDHEILGVGTLLRNWGSRCAIVHVTDGAPRSGEDASNANCTTWQEYAALRARATARALTVAGAAEADRLCLDCPDQQAVFHIAKLADHLAAVLDDLQASVVFTHAYEGGHPDHDATAASVHAAIHLLKGVCTLAEFAGYHAVDHGNGMACECFLESRDRENGNNVLLRPLTSAERQWKREVLNCYPSQTGVLAQFPLRYEPVRLAPTYDFAQPPHSGRLYYENFTWGVSPHEWWTLARRAFRDLGVPCEC